MTAVHAVAVARKRREDYERLMEFIARTNRTSDEQENAA